MRLSLEVEVGKVSSGVAEAAERGDAMESGSKRRGAAAMERRSGDGGTASGGLHGNVAERI
jgi:hypothetical protein